MQSNHSKVFIAFVVGFAAGALMLGVLHQAEKSNVEQLNLRNTQELSRLQSLLVGARKEVADVLARAVEAEKRADSLQVKLEESKKAGGTIKLEGEDFSKVHQIDVGASPVKGPKNAAVTIVQFVDLQCPFCNKFYPVISEVLKAYPYKVNFVIKNFPLSFHANARPAAKLALAANEQGKYFEMVELLLSNKAEVNESKIKEYAKKLRLNTKRLIKDYKEKDAQWEAQIKEDIKLGQQVDVRGTPTFFVNGRKTQAREFAAFKSEIDLIPQ